MCIRDSITPIHAWRKRDNTSRHLQDAAIARSRQSCRASNQRASPRLLEGLASPPQARVPGSCRGGDVHGNPATPRMTTTTTTTTWSRNMGGKMESSCIRSLFLHQFVCFFAQTKIVFSTTTMCFLVRETFSLLLESRFLQPSNLVFAPRNWFLCPRTLFFPPSSRKPFFAPRKSFCTKKADLIFAQRFFFLAGNLGNVRAGPAKVLT